MELREALKVGPTMFYIGDSRHGYVVPSEVYEAIASAARAELARREGMESVRIRNAEGICRDMAGLKLDEPKRVLLERAADILKAVHEKVVPWLRQLQCDTNARAFISRNQAIAYGGGQFGGIGDMLVALGEDAP